MSSIFKKQQKKDTKSSTASSSATASIEDVGATSTSSYSSSRSSSRTKIGSATNLNLIKDGESHSELGRHHGSHTSNAPSTKTSSKDGKRPEAKRQTTKELKKEYMPLQLEHQQLLAQMPTDFDFVKVFQKLKLTESTYEAHKDKLVRLYEEKKAINEMIEDEKKSIEDWRKEKSAASNAHRELCEHEDRLIKEQHDVLDKMPDKHPYKIEVLTAEKKKKAADDKYHLKAEKAKKKEAVTR